MTPETTIGVTLEEIIISLTILYEQFKVQGIQTNEIDELTFSKNFVKLRRGTKTIKIPLKLVRSVQ